VNKFGESLRGFRQQCKDLDRQNRILSQERFGELLGIELGTSGYSGAAVSDWERGVSKIHADDRRVLICLLKVLHERGGLKSLSEADELLGAGNYRALNAAEGQEVFPEDGMDLPPVSPAPTHAQHTLLDQLLFGSNDQLQSLITKAEEGPPPVWPRVLVALWRNMMDHWSNLSVLQAIIWIWIWLLTWLLTAPSLRLSFANQEQVSLGIRLFIAASLAIPMLIGLLTNTKDNLFWKKHGLGNAITTRLYVYQGAGIGFNLGYFFVFGISLFGYSLHIASSPLFELAAAALPLILGNMAARLAPYNLWLAYGRMSIVDGWIFFIAALFGPLWGLFFTQFYSILLTPVLGVFMILLAITIIAVMEERRK
jgi:transcriptional regulator with XRE-family HTH domain